MTNTLESQIGKVHICMLFNIARDPSQTKPSFTSCAHCLSSGCIGIVVFFLAFCFAFGLAFALAFALTTDCTSILGNSIERGSGWFEPDPDLLEAALYNL